MKRKKLCKLMLCVLLLFAAPMTVYGQETETTQELDYSDIQKLLDESGQAEQIQFEELVEQFRTGELDMDGFLAKLWQFLCESLFEEFIECKEAVIQIFILVIASAVLTRFADIFEKPYISGMSFYMVYLLLLLIMTQFFSTINTHVVGALDSLVEFMKVLVPVYSMVLAFSAGSATALGFYELAVLVIYLIERIFLYALIPFVHVYVVIVLADRLFSEEYLTKLAELMKGMIGWVIKILFGFVVGMNLVQSLVSPAVDALKSNVVAKSLAAIPGVGNALGSVTEVMIGSGAVLRNGIGVAAMLVLFVLCLGPCIKIAVVAFSFKLTAAILQPVGDGRIVGSISDVGEGMSMLAKVMLTAEVLFLLQIAMITASSGWVNR